MCYDVLTKAVCISSVQGLASSLDATSFSCFWSRNITGRRIIASLWERGDKDQVDTVVSKLLTEHCNRINVEVWEAEVNKVKGFCNCLKINCWFQNIRSPWWKDRIPHSPDCSFLTMKLEHPPHPEETESPCLQNYAPCLNLVHHFCRFLLLKIYFWAFLESYLLIFFINIVLSQMCLYKPDIFYLHTQFELDSLHFTSSTLCRVSILHNCSSLAIS